MTSARGSPVVRLGIVDAASDSLEAQGQSTASIVELREAHEGTLPKYF